MYGVYVVKQVYICICTRDCSGDGFTGDITCDKIITGEAFLTGEISFPQQISAFSALISTWQPPSDHSHFILAIF